MSDSAEMCATQHKAIQGNNKLVWRASPNFSIGMLISPMADVAHRRGPDVQPCHATACGEISRLHMNMACSW